MRRESFVLLSKLQLPRLNPRSLYRARLVNLITENIAKKLVILCAGAGYGKTTLLAQFFAETNIDFIYYQLKKEDNDPTIFLSHLIAGFQRFKPEFGKNVKRLTQFYNLPEQISDIVLGTFINEVVENIKDNTFLILDDYHTLSPSKTIDNIVSYFLLHLPENLHLIISTRSRPSVSTAELRVKGDLLEIDTDMFRFTKEEINALLTTLFSTKFDEKLVDWLYEYSEGWPACIRLILQSYETAKDTEPNTFLKKLPSDSTKITENIFDYFAGEVFENESPETQQLLIDWSVLDYLNSEVCNAISHRKDCDKILENLSQRNAFIYSLPDGGYRIHYLFREFLRNRLVGEERKRQLYKCLAQYWYESNKDEALKYFILAQEYLPAIKIIEFIGRKSLEQGKYQILCSSIEQIPENLIHKNPLILKYYGEALTYLGNSPKAKEILTNALIKSRKNNALKAETLYTFAGISINEGKLNQAMRYLRRLLKICPKGLNLIKSSALNSLGAINNTIGGRNLLKAKSYFKEAYRIAEKDNYQELKTSILNNLGMNEYKQGYLKEAYSKISQAIQLLKDHFSLGCGAGFYNGARIALLLGYVDQAQSILDAGLEVCKPFNDPWSRANIWRGYCLLYQKKNDFKKAREFIGKALEIYEGLKIPYLLINTLTELCRIEVMENNIIEAQNILNRIWELKKTKDAEAIAIMILQTELKILQEQIEDAETVVSEAKRLAQKYNLNLELFLLNLLYSDIFYKKNRLKRAKEYLISAISMAKKKDYDYLLLEEMKRRPYLIKFMIENHINSDYLFSLLKKFRGFHIMQVFFFGEPTLYIDGNEVKDIDWKTTKAKKLFFYILLNKYRMISQETLIDSFWQESGLKKGYDSLRKAISHIRQTLRNYYIDEPFVIHSGFYQCAPDLLIISDIDKFEELIKELKFKRKNSIKFKMLLDIYKNGFAHSWYDNWAVEQADRLRQMFEGVTE